MYGTYGGDCNTDGGWVVDKCTWSWLMCSYVCVCYSAFPLQYEAIHGFAYVWIYFFSVALFGFIFVLNLLLGVVAR